MKIHFITLKILPRSRKALLRYVIGILLYISSEILLIYALGSRASIIEFLPYYLVSTIYFFGNIVLLLNIKGYGYKAAIAAFVLLVFGYALHTFLLLLIDHFELKISFKDFQRPNYAKKISRSNFVLLMSIAFWFALKNYNSVKEAGEEKLLRFEAEKRRLQLEIEILRVKLNPHFLFNTLNLVYSTVNQVSNKAAEIILMLTELLRYNLTQVGEDGKVSLKMEIEKIERYITLNKLRLNDQLILNYSKQIVASEEVRIPPMLLLTPLENMFKHGKLNDATFPATIYIECKAGLLLFHTANLKRKDLQPEKMEIGISHTKSLLSIFYSDKYEINIRDTETNYVLDLKIQL